MTTKTENEVPENNVDHKAPPSKSECYDLPAIYFSAKFLKFIRIASARAKNTYFRSFEGFQGRWHKSGAFGPQHLPPFLFCWCFQPFYVWGGVGLCLFISRHRLFAPIRLVCCFSCCSLCVFFIHCLFFPSSAALQFEGKGGRERKTRRMKNDKQQNIKKANQGDKGGIARKTWNTKIKKHNKEEKQNRKTKTDLLLFLSFWVVGLSLGEILPGTKGLVNTIKPGFLLFFFLFVGVLLGKLTKRTITRTKLRRQDNKTTRQQKNNTGTKTKQQQ